MFCTACKGGDPSGKTFGRKGRSHSPICCSGSFIVRAARHEWVPDGVPRSTSTLKMKRKVGFVHDVLRNTDLILPLLLKIVGD